MRVTYDKNGWQCMGFLFFAYGIIAKRMRLRMTLFPTGESEGGGDMDADSLCAEVQQFSDRLAPLNRLGLPQK
jgi:hypothetical protein